MAKKNQQISKRVLEKNINVFNHDVSSEGSYFYTDKNKLSALLATEKQTKEIINFLKTHVNKTAHILDVGCGDGTYTFEMYKNFRPKKITAFDVATNAIKSAKNKNKYKKQINFLALNIYDCAEKLETNYYDIAVIRGVLHHLYKPEQAIKEISKIANKIIVLEPNGYNPLLKIIEKVSPYHKIHEEKSYWPPTLNNWFEKYGFKVIDQKFFGIVPYFFPNSLTKILKTTERFFESIPFFHMLYCGTNIIYFEKKEKA